MNIDSVRNPAARVQLWEADSEGPTLHGTWEKMPWGLHDFCYGIELDSGQCLNVWLEGATEGEHPPEKPMRIVLVPAEVTS